MATKTIQNYLDFVQKEQDELTLQKNYLNEATRILTSSDLKDSYQAFLACLNDYPSYLFKKEKEFMFFLSKINEKLNISTDDSLKFHDPNIEMFLDELIYKVDIYHTVHGVYDLNFSFDGNDMALRLEIDMPGQKVIVFTQDLLGLNVDGQAKSKLVHYLVDVMEIFKEIDFKITRETTTNIDPFLMFEKLEFQRLPHFVDLDFDRLFIAMNGEGNMEYMDDQNKVHLQLDNEHEIYIISSPAEDVTDIEILHHNGEIYLFDLLAAFPYVEQLFTGEVLLNDNDKENVDV